jgi:Uma2 family endonuclease
MSTKREATIDDLWHVEGKAELVNGELVLMSAAGDRHGRAALRIAASLLEYENRTGHGHALPDNVGFIVNLPHRRSFSPDAAYALQPPGDGFVDAAPVFAVEVRSPDDYGPAAERAMADKRADYFAAGTLVVWDVDTLGGSRGSRVSRERSRPSHHLSAATGPTRSPPFGWSMPVDDLFPS